MTGGADGRLSSWPQMARYLQAMDKAAAANRYRSLSEIDVPWFRKEMIAI